MCEFFDHNVHDPYAGHTTVYVFLSYGIIGLMHYYLYIYICILLCTGDHILLKPLTFIVNSPSHFNVNMFYSMKSWK